MSEQVETVQVTMNLPKNVVRVAKEFILKRHGAYEDDATVEEFFEREATYTVVSLVDAMCGKEHVDPETTLEKYGLLQTWKEWNDC